MKNNYAFVDAQNVHRGIKNMGWQIDWLKLRVYLRDKYFVTTAYVFIGYIKENRNLYLKLKEAGYILIFKPVTFGKDKTIKGNCDADLVLYVLTKKNFYDKAVILTSDGDFYLLVRYLYQCNKLEMVLSSHVHACSKLLKKEAKERLNYMYNLRAKLAINENAPHKDETL